MRGSGIYELRKAHSLAQRIAQPVFLADRALSILPGGDVTATVTFVIPEVLGLLRGVGYFKS
jgi:hypothetical protein